MGRVVVLATTFQKSEVDTLLTVASVLQRGGSTDVLIRSVEWRAVVRKFQRLQRKSEGSDDA